MHIAQVAPLFESVPPQRYGGTERVVSWLTEELVALGHDVTLFASADSHTRATLVPCCEQGLRLARSEDEISPHVLQFERALDPRRHFDMVHFHTGTQHFNIARRAGVPTVTTMHGRLDLTELGPLAWEFRELPLVSISDQQREPLPWAHWAGTVHHGLPPQLFRLDRRGGGGLVFVGRISPEKRPDRAIRIARAAGVPLTIAAKVDRKDKDYFDRVIAPMLADADAAGDDVRFIGEVDDASKQALVGRALGLVFPIDWPEPFGLVMIEAMACGTPVVAWRRGSAPSVIEEARSGFLVEDEDAAVEAVQRLITVDRREVRSAFEERFTARRMALDYLAIYEQVIEDARTRTPPDSGTHMDERSAARNRSPSTAEVQELLDGRHT
jgi:glycosyltransferase involved in cell wall biosynthesis